MKISRKIIKIGNSNAITLPKEVNVNAGDVVIFEIKILDVLNQNEEILYKCLDCGKPSMSPNYDIFCKHCGKEDLEIISEDIEDVIKEEFKNEII